MSHIHLPDGVLPWWIWLGGYAVMALLLVLLFSWKLSRPDPRRFALLGIFAALMILVMSIEVPFIPYHINLTVVAGIVLGPALGIVAVCIVNVVLAFLGHGGITVVGVNALAMTVELLVGIGVFRGLLRLRAPLALAGFLAVMIGLGCGTAASYGVVTLAAPSIDRNLAQMTDHGHEEHHEALGAASQGGQINLRRLAVIMFGIGLFGWLLEALLSVMILRALARVLPEIIGLRGEESHGSVPD